jgi:hypothetical protein
MEQLFTENNDEKSKKGFQKGWECYVQKVKKYIYTLLNDSNNFHLSWRIHENCLQTKQVHESNEWASQKNRLMEDANKYASGGLLKVYSAKDSMKNIFVQSWPCTQLDYPRYNLDLEMKKYDEYGLINLPKINTLFGEVDKYSEARRQELSKIKYVIDWLDAHGIYFLVNYVPLSTISFGKYSDIPLEYWQIVKRTKTGVPDSLRLKPKYFGQLPKYTIVELHNRIKEILK